MRVKHHNPLHLIAIAGLVMIVVAAYQDPDLSRYLVHWPGTARAFTITNGMDALNVLGKSDFTSNGIETTQSGTDNVEGVGYDSVNDRLYVADRTNDRILVFELAGGITNGMNATNVLGQTDFVTGDPGTTSSSSLATPAKVHADAANDRLFVSDTGNCRILVFDTSGGITDGMGATYALGQDDFGPAVFCTSNQNSMHNPRGTVYDSANQRLFVADTTNDRVLVFDLSSGITTGMNAANVLGQVDFSGSSNATTQNRMNNPEDVAYDSANDRLFVADANNNRVLVFDVSSISDGALASYVLGQEDFTTSTAGYDQDTVRRPQGVSYDSTNSLLDVSLSTLNHRVLVFDLSSGITNGMNASYVLGQSTFTDVGSATTQNGMNSPSDVEYDTTNDRLFVADYSNRRVLVFGDEAVAEEPSSAGAPPYYPPGYTGFFPVRITVNDDSSSTDSRNVLVQAYADFTDSFSGTVDLMLSNKSDFSTFQSFRFTINDAPSDRSTWPKTIAWDLCAGLSEDQLCDPGTKTVYARFFPNVPQPSSQLSTPTPTISATITPAPVRTTVVPSPATCPVSCRQLGLYGPGEVTEAGCRSPGAYGYNTCLRSDPNVNCKTIHRAAGRNCFVPNRHTNYCFRCP